MLVPLGIGFVRQSACTVAVSNPMYSDLAPTEAICRSWFSFPNNFFTLSLTQSNQLLSKNTPQRILTPFIS